MTTKARTLLPLPDPPEREPDDMTSVQHLGENGNLHHLIQYLGNPDTTNRFRRKVRRPRTGHALRPANLARHDDLI